MKPREAGLALLEVMIALSILAAVLISLTGIMYQTTRSAKISANATNRAAAQQTTESFLQSLAYDSIPSYLASSGTGCSSQTAGAFKYTLCLTYVDSSKFYRLTAIIRPDSGQLSYTAPETIVVNRAHPPHAANFNLH